MATTVFGVLNNKLTEHKTSAQEFLNNGGAKDFAGYREGCGVIQGLNIALRELNDLSRKYMEEDDE